MYYLDPYRDKDWVLVVLGCSIFNTGQEQILQTRGGIYMPEKEDDEIVDSQKLSSRDKKELKEGLCVNCAIFAFIFMFVAMIALVL
jgi:hypothetical protein